MIIKVISVVIIIFAAAFVANYYAQETRQTYRLIISFGSECCGINKDAEKKISKLISNYEREKKVKLHRKKVYWGKEGEFDYCYVLSEISVDEQTRLISQIIEVARNSKLVEVRENSTNPNEN